LRRQGRCRVRKVKVLVIARPALSHVVRHVFRGRREFEVVASLTGLRNLKQRAGALLPDLIVANVSPLRTDIRRAVTCIKRSSPLSKLILICPIREFADGARRCGADACLEEEKLLGLLLPTARALSERPLPAPHRNYKYLPN